MDPTEYEEAIEWWYSQEIPPNNIEYSYWGVINVRI